MLCPPTGLHNNRAAYCVLLSSIVCKYVKPHAMITVTTTASNQL